MKFLSDGLSKRQALIKAGYSLNSANQASRILATKSMEKLVGTFRDKLLDVGLDSRYFAAKIKEWAEAKKYDTQIEAYDRWIDVMRL